MRFPITPKLIYNTDSPSNINGKHIDNIGLVAQKNLNTKQYANGGKLETNKCI